LLTKKEIDAILVTWI